MSYIRKAMFLSMALALVPLAACDVDQTDEGSLPDVDVQGGDMPEYDVDVPDVDVGIDTVTVPDIDVDVPGEGGETY